MNESYLDAARWGRQSGWRYLLGILFILFMYLVVGGVLAVFVAALFGGSAQQLATEPSLLGLIEGYLALNVTFLPFLAGVVLAVTLIHRRSVLSLITAQRSIDWRRVGLGFGVWGALIILSSVVSFLIWPSSFSFGPNLAAFIPFAIVALILTPIQTTTEELFFRGYLIQGLSVFSGNFVFLALTSGVLFGLPHLLNPEAEHNLLLAVFYYCGFGIFIAWVCLKEGTLELAIGLHAANNLWAAIGVTAEDGTFNTPSLFRTDLVSLGYNDIALAVMMVLFAVAVFVLFKRRPAPASRVT